MSHAIKQKVEALRQWRLNQPSMTSEEALQQMRTIRRNVAARSGSDTRLRETPSSDGLPAPDASSKGPTS